MSEPPSAESRRPASDDGPIPMKRTKADSEVSPSPTTVAVKAAATVKVPVVVIDDRTEESDAGDLEKTTPLDDVAAAVEKEPYAAPRSLLREAKPGQQSWTCKCKKSMCRKGWCDCFVNSVPCSAQCSCTNCHNTQADGNRPIPPSANGPATSSLLPPSPTMPASKSQKQQQTKTSQPLQSQSLPSFAALQWPPLAPRPQEGVPAAAKPSDHVVSPGVELPYQTLATTTAKAAVAKLQQTAPLMMGSHSTVIPSLPSAAQVPVALPLGTLPNVYAVLPRAAAITPPPAATQQQPQSQISRVTSGQRCQILVWLLGTDRIQAIAQRLVAAARTEALHRNPAPSDPVKLINDRLWNGAKQERAMLVEFKNILLRIQAVVQSASVPLPLAQPEVVPISQLSPFHVTVAPSVPIPVQPPPAAYVPPVALGIHITNGVVTDQHGKPIRTQAPLSTMAPRQLIPPQQAMQQRQPQPQQQQQPTHTRSGPI